MLAPTWPKIVNPLHKVGLCVKLGNFFVMIVPVFNRSMQGNIQNKNKRRGNCVSNTRGLVTFTLLCVFFISRIKNVWGRERGGENRISSERKSKETVLDIFQGMIFLACYY